MLRDHPQKSHMFSDLLHSGVTEQHEVRVRVCVDTPRCRFIIVFSNICMCSWASLQKAESLFFFTI